MAKACSVSGFLYAYAGEEVRGRDFSWIGFHDSDSFEDALIEQKAVQVEDRDLYVAGPYIHNVPDCDIDLRYVESAEELQALHQVREKIRIAWLKSFELVE